MPFFLLGAIALFGLGYWFKTRPKGLPPALPPNATPQQIVMADAAPLAKEILDLLYNGRDPRAMHAVASELEKDGFFDAAAILHKRAAELETVPAPPGHVVPGTPPQGGPQGGDASAMDAAMGELRNEISLLDTQYGALNQQIQGTLQPAIVANWNTNLAIWRKFVFDFERNPSVVGIPTLQAQLADFQKTLASWRATYAREIGVTSPVPQTPPAPSMSAELPPGTVPTLFGTRGTVTKRTPLDARYRPDFTSAIVLSIPTGGSVNVTNSMGDFYLVTYQGKTGWVPKQSISLGFDPQTSIPGATAFIPGGTGLRRGISS